MTVTGGGVPNGTTISVGGIIGMRSRCHRPLMSRVEVLQFGFLGAPITTDAFFVDDTAAAVGALIAAADDPTNVVATVVGVDAASGAITLMVLLKLMPMSCSSSGLPASQ